MPNRLIRQARGRPEINHTDLILKITQRFTSTLELNQVLSQVLSLTVEAVGAERGSIFVLDSAGHVTHKILARWYLPPAESDQIIAVVLQQGAAGYVYRSRQPVLITDTRTDGRWLHLPDDPYVTRSALSVPLVQRNQFCGILTLTHAEPAHFDQEDLALVTSIAGQAAVAIENARLFERVHNEQARLQAVMASVTEGIIITDTEGQVLYANPAGVTALGIKGGGTGWYLQDVSADPPLAERLAVLLETQEPQRFEVPGNDGHIYEASMVQVPGAGIVTTLHDVTHFKLSDAQKSDFVTNVSHDLKSPLGLIYGYAWMLAELPELDATMRHYVEMILDGIQRMQQLINALLDLTLIESERDMVREWLDVHELIHESLSAFESRIKDKNLRLTLSLSPDLTPVRGHAVRLGQALNNLLSNAVKYTPPHGEITVSACVEEGYALIRVSDTGPGIPLDKQDQLFQKFFRVSTRETLPYEGHGLGLAIVKSVAEAHGGWVGVESEPGAGATFTLALPLPAPPDLPKDLLADRQGER